jgi:large subunit ribosomal protein L35
VPKIKTHKATAKRFKHSSTGKIRRVRGPKSHLRRKKSKRVRRQLAEMIEVTNVGNKKRIARLAPYLKRKKK